ncbi:M15 family metallopeptidase [Zeaxanthinibacter enoshimensis]|uniref:D-alanyl-D-alanine dipeptidase n=1 Tax=Zeaxanthinibacter enoshimensis TaxID=392009 RepID=A0A4R6TN05_9FLAO|nr:M15 family metallopeptidase [Zeaxanthinibacter enoshimensis]TDQ31129.1 D-alanyl-D-alanine dipeptidase [Zeaxanthinibacter enoshimensis]
MIRVLILGLSLLILSCKETTSEKKVSSKPETNLAPEDSLSVVSKQAEEVKLKSLDNLSDTTFIRLADYSRDFSYDLRYATENNFMKEKVYECGECYLRAKTAKALMQANDELMKKGYRIRFFDCYRPRSVQYIMWEIVPNPQYVANPDKGSIHNRGGAVDITLETLEGVEVDMGTDFDYFGKKAYHDNTDLPEKILANRKLLKETMEKYGFWSIRTEWWHYNLGSASRDKIAEFEWECDTVQGD